jgi:hypothetical protein
MQNFSIDYNINNNTLTILYNYFPHHDFYTYITTNVDSICCYIENTDVIGLRIVPVLATDKYKDLLIYDKEYGMKIPQDLIDCFNWILETNYIEKLKVFE